jgi:N-methylhydantoinase B
LSAVGFPSGVAGVPAEVIENLSPLLMRRRQLWPDSGGAGERRGGLGQLTEFTRRGTGRWSVSCIVDRCRYAAPGLAGGKEGTAGELYLDSGERPNPKSLVDLEPNRIVHLNTPGGGGYGDPLERDPERVRQDVIAGYVSPESAEREYGVVVRFTGDQSELVRLPDQWVIDGAATEVRRKKIKPEG